MTATTHTMRTVGDIVRVLATIEPERASVMLRELQEALVLAATMRGLLTDLGLDFNCGDEFVWTDDDLGEKRIQVQLLVDDEAVEQFTLDLKEIVDAA